jgi:hypothetical protein
MRVFNHLSLLENMMKLYEKDKRYCPISGEQHCCIDDFGMELANSNNGTVEITQNKFLENYKLTIESKMNEIEKKFGEDISLHPLREIWIFSYNLRTEVLDDSSQRIAADNVDKGVKYTYFHTNNSDEQDEIEANKQKIYSIIPDGKCNTNIAFVPLEDTDIEGLDIFDHIIGSIIFVSPTENSCKESYFSLRGDDNPIYFKLPRCMNREYYNYFNERKTQYEDNKPDQEQ